MKQCQNCGADVGSAKICPACGEEVEVSELELEATNSVDVENSLNSGSCTEDEIAEKPNECEPHILEAQEKPKRSKKAFIIIGAVLALLIIVLSVCFVLLKGESKSLKSDITLFVKDNSLFYMNPAEEKPILVTENLFKDWDEINLNLLYDMDTIEYIDNGNQFYYPQKIDMENNSYSLYCRNINKIEEEPIKLAENVDIYSVADNGKAVIYLDKDGNLYFHNLEERKRILSDVSEYWISDDCLSIAYLSEDGGLYRQEINAEKFKIDSDVTEVDKISPDLMTIYYRKESELYRKQGEEDRVKIDSDVSEVVAIFENGDVYFTKENESENQTGTLLDFIEDKKDTIEVDEKIANKEFVKVTDSEKISAVLRFWAREELKEKESPATANSLYYYNGEKVDLINNMYAATYSVSDKSLVIKSFDNVKANKISIEEFVNAVDKEGEFRKDFNNGYTIYQSEFSRCKFIDEYEAMIKGVYESDATTYIVESGKPVLIENENGKNFKISKKGDSIYFIDKIDKEKETGDVYHVSFAECAITNTELLDSEVSTNGFSISNSGKLIYKKDVKDSTFDLYIGGTLVDYDVANYSFTKDGSVLYCIDYDDDFDIGTYYIYSAENKVKVDEEAYWASEDAYGNIIYLLNYSKNSNKGDLYIFKNGEASKVDYDVSLIINSDSSRKYRNILSGKITISW